MVVGETSISHVEGDIGRLSYRGVPIDQVVEMDYLSAAYLVLFGDEPNEDELSTFEIYMLHHGELTEHERRFIDSLPKGVHPMEALQAMIPLLCRNEQAFADESIEATTGLQIIAKYPALIAAIRSSVTGASLPNVESSSDYLERFLLAMTGEIPSQRNLAVFKTVQLLQMDHSFNAGTFASRVIGSTLAPVPAVLSGAVGALSGVLHGGADEAALTAAREVGRPEAAAAYVDQILANKGRLMGMGHREYRIVDPRSQILKPMAEELCRGSRFENEF